MSCSCDLTPLHIQQGPGDAQNEDQDVDKQEVDLSSMYSILTSTGFMLEWIAWPEQWTCMPIYNPPHPSGPVTPECMPIYNPSHPSGPVTPECLPICNYLYPSQLRPSDFTASCQFIIFSFLHRPCAVLNMNLLSIYNPLIFLSYVNIVLSIGSILSLEILWKFVGLKLRPDL